MIRDGFEAERRVGFALGPPEMAHQNQPAAGGKNVPNCFQRALNARIIGDAPILPGHVEIHAREHPLAAQVHFFNCARRHRLPSCKPGTKRRIVAEKRGMNRADQLSRIVVKVTCADRFSAFNRRVLL